MAWTRVFSEAWTGTDGDAWDASKWVDQATADSSILDIQSNRGRMVADGAAYTHTRASANMSAIGTTRVTGTLELASTNEQFTVMAVNHDGTWSGGDPHNAYWVQFQPGNSEINIQRNDAGTNTQLDSVSFTFAATTLYQYIVERDVGSGLIRIKFWEDGTAEPTAWTLSVTDTTYTSGVVSLRMVNGNAGTAETSHWDNLVVSAWVNLQVQVSRQTEFTVRIYPPLTTATERHPPLHSITFDGMDTTFEIRTELPGGFAGAQIGGMIRRGEEILPAYLPRPASQLRPFAHVEISAGANVIWEGRADVPENDDRGEPVGFKAKGYWSAFTDNFYEGDSSVDLTTGQLLRDMTGQVAPMLTVGDGVQFEDPGNLHSPEEYHRRKGSAVVDAINKQGDEDGNPVDVAVWHDRTVWLTSRVAPDRPHYLIQPGTPGVQIDEMEWSELWGEVWIEFTDLSGDDQIAGPFTDRTFEDRFGFMRRTVLDGGTLTRAAAERVARTFLTQHSKRQYAISVNLDNGTGLTRLDGGRDAPWNVRAGSWARVPGYGDFAIIETAYQSTSQSLTVQLNQQGPSWNRLLSRLQARTDRLAAGVNPTSGGRS